MTLDSIPGLALLSPTGNVDMVSRQALEYFGRTFEELNGWERTTRFTLRICLLLSMPLPERLPPAVLTSSRRALGEQTVSIAGRTTEVLRFAIETAKLRAGAP